MICPKPTQEWPTKHGFVTSNESEQNSSNITPLFSNCTSDNGVTENNKVMAPKSRLHSWLVTNTTLCLPLRDCLKRDNSGSSYLTCITHVRHVGLKRVTHMFHYSTYTFEKKYCIWKERVKAYTCPTEMRSTIKFDDQCETLIPEAEKKNNLYISLKTKATHRYLKYMYEF
jgi:23S rRNA C2498 (ribose-2'-O)-methylase RlmM